MLSFTNLEYSSHTTSNSYPTSRWDNMLLPLATLNSELELNASLECSHSTLHLPSQPFSNQPVPLPLDMNEIRN